MLQASVVGNSVNAFKALRYAQQGGDGGLKEGFYFAPVKTGRGIAAHVLDTKFNQTKTFIVAPTGVSDVKMTTADIQASGVSQIIAAVPNTKGSLIKIFQRDGKLTKEVRPFGTSERGALSIFAADVEGNGTDEIIVSSSKLKRALILGGDGAVRATINVPETKGTMYVTAQRMPDRTLIVTAVQNGKQVNVYMWDQFGTYISDFTTTLPTATAISIGFAPTSDGVGQLYLAQLTSKALNVRYLTHKGLATQVITARPTEGNLFGFAFGRVNSAEEMHLVIGALHRTKAVFESVDSLGGVVSRVKNNELKPLKFTSLYFGQ